MKKNINVMIQVKHHVDILMATGCCGFIAS